jgi:hypothetical protein
VSSSDPLRLPETQVRLLLALSQLGKATVPDLVRSLRGSEAEVLATTAHALLLRLQTAGLVKSTKTPQNRLWSLSDPAGFFELLRADARRTLVSRYASDPQALRALLVEIQQLLSEPSP